MNDIQLRDVLQSAVDQVKQPTKVDTALQLIRLYKIESAKYFNGTLHNCILKTAFDEALTLLAVEVKDNEQVALKILKDFQEESLVLLLQ